MHICRRESMKSRGVRRQGVASTLPCKLLQAAASCIPTPCFGFTTFPGHKDFHKDLSLHRKYRNPYRSLGHVSICPNRQQILGESNGTRCVTSVVGGDHKLVSSCFVYFLFLLFAFKAKKCQTHCQFLPFLVSNLQNC